MQRNTTGLYAQLFPWVSRRKPEPRLQASGPNPELNREPNPEPEPQPEPGACPRHKRHLCPSPHQVSRRMHEHYFTRCTDAPIVFNDLRDGELRHLCPGGTSGFT